MTEPENRKRKMGRPAIPPEKRRNLPFRVLLSIGELRYLQLAAEREGTRPTTLVRELILARVAPTTPDGTIDDRAIEAITDEADREARAVEAANVATTTPEEFERAVGQHRWVDWWLGDEATRAEIDKEREDLYGLGEDFDV